MIRLLALIGLGYRFGRVRRLLRVRRHAEADRVMAALDRDLIRLRT